MGKISKIVEAAEHLFAEQGYEHTPVSEIAKRAGVAGGTIIYHFKNKENLLFIVTWRVLYSLYKQSLSACEAGTNGLRTVECLMDAFFDFLRDHRGEYRVLLRNTAFDTLDVDAFPNADLRLLHDRHMQLIEDALRRGAEDGSIKPDCGDDAAHILFAMLMGSARLHIYHGYDVESLRNEARTFASARLSA